MSMTSEDSQDLRWLDFSGAPPLLIPRRRIAEWCGPIDPQTAVYRDLNESDPVTDYDRACAAAWPGRGSLPVGDSFALALYTEYDVVAWHPSLQLIACGGWIPTSTQLLDAAWTDYCEWTCADGDLILLNSAADGRKPLRSADSCPVCLQSAIFNVQQAALEADRVGLFYRFLPMSQSLQQP